MSTLGYRSDFLGEDKVFELPTISFEHQGDIVFPDGATEEDGPELKYLNQQDVYSEISQLADVHIRIPMLGVKQSLNVAVAGGVVLYEPEFPIWNSDSNMVLALFS